MISDEKLYDIAVEYYLRHKTQAQIAKEYDVSHVQIGYYLKEAQKRGIVTISVNMPADKDETDSLNNLFCKIFHIKNLVLVQGSDNSDKSQMLVVKKAASYILETLPDNVTNIGIGWGKTIHDLSLQKMAESKKNNWIYSPVCMMSGYNDNPYFDTMQLVSNMSKNWGGKADDTFIKELLINKKFSKNEDEQPLTLDMHMLICGLGCSTSRFPALRAGLFSNPVFKEVNTKNLVGDILHNFYDIEGNLYGIDCENEILIPCEKIKKIPWVIAVACGFPKVESIIGGLNTGLVDTLVTDVQTARHVLDYLR